MPILDRRLFVAVVIAGALLWRWMRFAGLTRSMSYCNPPALETGAFYAFHPDEETLIHAALIELGQSVRPAPDYLWPTIGVFSASRTSRGDILCEGR